MKTKSALILTLTLLAALLPNAYCPQRSHRAAFDALITREEVGLTLSKQKTFLKSFASATASLPPPEAGIDYPYRSALAVLGTGLYLKMPLKDCGKLSANVFVAVMAGAPAEEAEDLAEYGLVIKPAVVLEAANALKQFKSSVVKPRVYNEFVLHAVEYHWQKGLLPVLCRGLVYAAERGLNGEKAALAMMVDVDQGKRDGDEIVMRMITTLRQLYPRSWKPLSSAERKLKYLRQEKEKALRRDIKQVPTPSPKLEKKIKLQEKIVERQRQSTKKKRISRRIEAEEKAVQKARAQSAKKRRGRPTSFSSLKAAVSKWLGVPYKFGGEDKYGVDCSAFTRAVCNDLGVTIPRNSRQQARVGSEIRLPDLKAGDLVFFDMKFRGRISHVGVYMGEGKFAHASCSKGVTNSNFQGGYYQKRYVKARRIL